MSAGKSVRISANVFVYIDQFDELTVKVQQDFIIFLLRQPCVSTFLMDFRQCKGGCIDSVRTSFG